MTASDPKLDQMVRNILGQVDPKLTPIHPKTQAISLPVHILYDGDEIRDKVTLNVSLIRPNPDGITAPSTPVMTKTLFLDSLSRETELAIALPEIDTSLYVDVIVRDASQNIISQAQQPVPIKDEKALLVHLIRSAAPPQLETQVPDFTAIETVSGKIHLPKTAKSLSGATLHVQLLEDALAGGLSMSLAAEQSIPLEVSTGEVAFALERGLWDRVDDPSLVFKAWVSDPVGRKIFVMNTPVIYRGPDLDYEIRLDALKQGKDTKRGLNLRPELMAQTLIQGEANFEPVNGIPGEARLKIVLKQDRGQYNRNPILTEQTLILRGMETRVPFSLTTDSTHFDPYAPSPFLSVSLTDKFGRIYYQSGDIRAHEGRNNLRLYPR